MVVRITSPHSLKRALKYNEQKVVKGKALCIHAGNYILSADQLNFHQKMERMQSLIARNERTKKTNTLHISLNFHPGEKLNNEKLTAIAEAYMVKIGFGCQPYLVYKHDDAGHPHVHIVTTTIQANGQRIDTFNIGRNQSTTARKEIEREFNLVTPRSVTKKETSMELAPVQYGKLETRRAISNVLQQVLHSFNYSTLPELNALLSLYNVQADPGKVNSIKFKNKGLTYHLLDINKNKTGVPIKASLIYNKPTLLWLEKRFEANKSKRMAPKQKLKSTIDQAVNKQPKSLKHFVTLMQAANINTVLRKNDEGLCYGITFIDMTTKTVFNGSDVGKEYSVANLQKNWSRSANGSQTQTNVLNKASSSDAIIPQSPQHQVKHSTKAEEKWEGKAHRNDHQLQALTSIEKESGKLPFELVRKKRKKKKNNL